MKIKTNLKILLFKLKYVWQTKGFCEVQKGPIVLYCLN